MRRLRGGAAGLSATPAPAPAPGLQRDRVTLAVYLMAGCWGWWLYAFGPAMVLLRDEQGTSRTAASLHGTMTAVGALVAGIVAPALVRRFGRRRVLAVGCAAMAASFGLLVTGTSLPFTLAGALLAGTTGSVAFTMVTPVLSVLHAESAPAAISEANALAATAGLLSPLAVGGAVAAGWGWRVVFVVAAAWLLLTAAAVVRVGPSLAWSTRPARATGPRQPFGRAFWMLWSVLVACIAAEFATTFWAADLLMTRNGMAPGRASAALSAFVAGMAAGRWIASGASRRWAPDRLLLVAIGVAAAGWALLWLAPSPVVAVAGLAVCGLGVAWHFPMGVSLLVRAAGGRPDAASSWASIGAGLASGAAPFALGAAADRVGPHTAFTIVPLVLAVAAATLWLTPRERAAVSP
ncbi:MFS transporter [Thalassiella azotivora]